ncbi:hypothetical protein [Chromobacterium violaceum]|uniref:hypothetical protein n=1 Tax=Chromobacterium violaceum TaxID=536 RepID=UPI000A68FDC7|nr:hypothetical protein [Chromobacterium violaceum]
MLAAPANRFAPRLRASGRRIDRVDFHPSRHDLLALYRSQGLVSLPFDSERFGR